MDRCFHESKFSKRSGPLPRMREDGQLKGKRGGVTRKWRKRPREEFEVRGFMAQKGLWNIARKRTLEDRGALPTEDGDLLREYQAMHEDNFLSRWLREHVEGKAEEREKLNKEAKEEESKSGKRVVNGERERVEMNSKRICMDRLASPDVCGKVFEAVCAVLRWIVGNS